MGESWKKHAAFTEGAHVKTICAPLKQLEIDGFFLMRIFPNGQFINLATNLYWTEYFLKNYFAEKYEFKTVKGHMATEHNINIWSIDQDNEQFIEAKQFGVKDGVSIKITQPKWQDVFSYYIHDRNNSNMQDLVNRIDILRKFSEYFLESANDIIDNGKKTPLIMPPKYLTTFNNTDRKINPQLREVLQKLLGDSALDLSGFDKLTKREMDCIEHAKAGLSSEAIGKKMCLSKRTVESYLVSARDKTNCKNLTELVYQYSFIKNLLT